MFVGAQVIGGALLDVHSVLFEFRWLGFVLLLPAAGLTWLIPEGPTIRIADRVEFEAGGILLVAVNAALWALLVWFFRKGVEQGASSETQQVKSKHNPS